MNEKQAEREALTTAAEVAAFIDRKADDYANRFGYGVAGTLSFGSQVKMDHYTSLTELAEEIRALAAPSASASPEPVVLYGGGETPISFEDGATPAALTDKRDTERLDFLDSLNRRLNEHYGTVYGWELILSPNIVRLMSGPGGRGHLAAIDLNDSKARGGKSCRETIDAAISASKEV